MKEADIKALIQDAEEIRDETETGANTAERVGTVLVSLAEGLTPDENQQAEGDYLPLTGGVLTGPLYFQTEGTTVAYIDDGTGSFASVATGGPATIGGTLTVGTSGSVNGNTTIHGNLDVREGTTLGYTEIEDLTVTGDATINDTLTVTGMATLNGGLTLNGDLTIGTNHKLLFGTSGDLYITGDGETSLSTVAANSLTVSTTAAIGGALTVTGDATVNDLTVRGNAEVDYLTSKSGLTVKEGATVLNDTLTVTSYVYGSNFYATSDERKKGDIQRITDDAVERASKVEAREYDLDGRRFGYVAQDVRRVLPSLVSEGEDGYLSLDYLSMLTLKNEALERRVQTLENQIIALAARLEKLENDGR